MKIAKFALITLCAVLLSSCTIKTTENNKRTVSVTGSGSVEVESDNCTIVLSVITKGKDVAAATQENASKMTKVQDSILTLGVSKDCITTSRFSVYPEYDYRNGKNTFIDYKVTNQINVFVKDLSLVSDVIDASLKNGANELSSCTYGVSDKDIYVKQARTLAVQNAQEAANLIAGTSGAMLGKVLQINEHENGFSGIKTYSIRASAANDAVYESAPTPISAGKQTVTFTVDAVYELR